MAFSCNIVRDNFDRILGVEAPNGKSSILFKDALIYLTDKDSSEGYKQEELEEAASMVAITQSPEFINHYTDESGVSTLRTDINGDPVLDDVLTYLKSTETHRMNEVSKMDLEDFRNQFPDLDYQTLENKLYTAFLDVDGNFVINEAKIRKSQLYNEIEIDNLLQDSQLQDRVKNNILALNKETFSDTFTGNFLNITTGQINSFGKMQTYDSQDLLDTILNSTVDAVTEEEFDTMFKAGVSEDVYNAILDNQELYNTVMDMALNLKKVEVRSAKDGIVRPVLERDIASELKETLILSNIHPDTIFNLAVLSDVSPEVLVENSEEFFSLAKSIETDLAESNIDILGFTEKMSTQDVSKVQDFIRALSRFTNSVGQGLVNDTIIETYSEVYNDFFNVQPRTELVSIEAFEQDVVRIDNTISKLDAYTNGFLKVRDNYYLQVAYVDYEDIVNSLLDSYETGSNLMDSIIPDNLRSEVQYRNHLDNFVMSRINSFGEIVTEEDLDNYKAITILEHLNGVVREEPKIYDRSSAEVVEESNKDIDYLTYDFPVELNQLKIQSKIQGNRLYNKIFQYLEFKDGAVRIKDREKEVVARIQNLLPNNTSKSDEFSKSSQPSTGGIKEGISEIFEETPELGRIGSQRQYSKYLDSIFPNSVAKDIVFHGTRNSFNEFSKEKLGSYTNTPASRLGFFFASNKNASSLYTESSWQMTKSSAEALKKVEEFKSQADAKRLLYKEKIQEYNSSVEELTNLKDKAQRKKLQSLLDKIINFFKSLLNTGEYESASSLTPLIQQLEVAIGSRKIELNSIKNEIEILTSKSEEDVEITSEYRFTGDSHVKSVLLNIENPLVENDKDRREEYDGYINRLNSAISSGNDGVIIENTFDPIETDIYVAFEPSQIHILGSGRDVEGFRNFMNSKASEELESTVQNPQYLHSISSSDRVLGELKNYFTETITRNNVDNQMLRDYYISNPSDLVVINKGYEIINGNALTTTLPVADFIRTKEGVFEKVDNINGVNLYSRLAISDGVIQPSTIDKTVVETNRVENIVKFNNNYTKSDKENLLADLNNCN